MAGFAVFAIAVFGATVLVQTMLRGTPLSGRKPFSCAACLGFWCAIALYPVSRTGNGQFTMWVLAAAGIAYILNRIVKD